ncbi:PadR family transcriptional regulator [Frankia sp. AgPm24]|uniref:PadR family transcriptional regulator n=2 Tax=Frankia TaxID=1854 RepID=A0ABT0JTZ3_9ACTN|nr:MULTISPECIES: PadR family transcriptional regulator [Frankia]MCK9875021.1 PadR family transcriptional regulator [Frankia umida]MCK9920569.1 PadR family transcriptional regulator [Frankia sp. AgPm24]
MLELAVLALLSESSMHGYELRKRLAALLGAFHRFSYGSLYPCLRRLAESGYVTADDVGASTRLGGRSRVVYTLTGEGKEKLAELLGEGGPSSWEDEMFGVRFAFFAKTDAAVRLRILEGRRGRLEERREKVRSALTRTVERFDSYTLELQRHGLESVEREVRWLNELIETERAATPAAATVSPQLSTGSTGLSTGSSTVATPPVTEGPAAGQQPASPTRDDGAPLTSPVPSPPDNEVPAGS